MILVLLTYTKGPSIVLLVIFIALFCSKNCYNYDDIFFTLGNVDFRGKIVCNGLFGLTNADMVEALDIFRIYDHFTKVFS